MAAGGVVNIPTPPATSGQNHDLLPWLGQIGQDVARFSVADDGADRCFEAQVFAARAGHALDSAVDAVAGAVMLVALERNQAIQMAGSDEDHVAATPAVTAVRPALANEFLATKADHAVAAVAAANVDFGFIIEHRVLSLLRVISCRYRSF